MTTTMKRTIPRTAGTPDTLLGEFGQPLERAVYSHRTSDGKRLLVAIGADGSIVASVVAPRVPLEPKGHDLSAFLVAHERWGNALGRIWIALEIADPCEVPEHVFPTLLTG